MFFLRFKSNRALLILVNDFSVFVYILLKILAIVMMIFLILSFESILSLFEIVNVNFFVYTFATVFKRNKGNLDFMNF